MASRDNNKQNELKEKGGDVSSSSDPSIIDMCRMILAKVERMEATLVRMIDNFTSNLSERREIVKDDDVSSLNPKQGTSTKSEENKGSGASTTEEVVQGDKCNREEEEEEASEDEEEPSNMIQEVCPNTNVVFPIKVELVEMKQPLVAIRMPSVRRMPFLSK